MCVSAARIREGRDDPSSNPDSESLPIQPGDPTLGLLLDELKIVFSLIERVCAMDEPDRVAHPHAACWPDELHTYIEACLSDVPSGLDIDVNLVCGRVLIRSHREADPADARSGRSVG